MFKDKEFWTDTFYRCLWTAAEVWAGVFVVGQTIEDIHWKHTLSITVIAVLACLIKQLGVYSRNHIKENYDDNE